MIDNEIKSIKEFNNADKNKYELEFKQGEKIVLEGKGSLKIPAKV